MQHILLTGATGFLGSHLLEALLQQGCQVTILKRSTSDTWRIAHLLGAVSSVDIDKTPPEKVFEEKHIDLVIHLATFYRKGDLASEKEEMYCSNVTFPLRLLNSGLNAGLKGFINTGTFFEFDCGILPVGETNELKPFNYYAKTKLDFDSALHTHKERLNIVTLNIFSPYGPNDNPKVIPYIIEQALKGAPLELSEGLQQLDFVYCSDVVEAYLKTIDYMSRSDNVCDSFNIGTGRPTSLREVVSIVEESLGVCLQKNWASSASRDFELVFADISKAASLLKWRPRTSLREGVIKTVRHYGEFNENQ